MSPSFDATLAHLQRIRPNDGWGVERKKESSGGLVRLTRRNVPITDSYFLDVHVIVEPPQNIVVGILTGVQRSDGTVQAQKLVDGNGKLLGSTVQLVSVSNYQNIRNQRGPLPPAGGSRASDAATATTATAVSDEQIKTLSSMALPPLSLP
jgi:hypothetical protein